MSNRPVYDICIAGAGATGSWLSAELVRLKHCRIALLDIGASNYYRDVYLGTPLGLQQTYKHGLGGTSQIWGGVLGEFDELDFSQTSSGQPLWPISKSELRPYYDQVLKEFGAHPKDLVGGYEKNAGVFSKIRQSRQDYKMFVQQLVRLVPAPNIFNEKVRRYVSHDIDCFTDAVVVGWNEPNNRTVEIEYLERGHKQKLVAKCFVICAGALATPHIIQAGIAKRQGRADYSDFLGRYLSDHLLMNVGKIRFEQAVDLTAYYRQKLNNRITLKSALGIYPENTQERLRMPNSRMYLVPSMFKKDNAENDARKKKFMLSRPKLTFANCRLGMQVPLPTLKALAYYTGMKSKFKEFDLFYFGEQVPNEASSVSYSSAENSCQLTRFIDWQVTDEDMQRMISFRSAVLKVLRPLISDAITSDDMDDLTRRVASAAHHCGTARMAYSSKSGVVDKDLRLFESRRVFVCDASVLPSPGAANPILTLLALASRLANHLSARNR